MPILQIKLLKFKERLSHLLEFTRLASGNRDLNPSISDLKASGVLSMRAANPCMTFLLPTDEQGPFWAVRGEKWGWPLSFVLFLMRTSRLSRIKECCASSETVFPSNLGFLGNTWNQKDKSLSALCTQGWRSPASRAA